MPCNDVTESIRIVLDKGDRIESYILTKKTCGEAVGMESLLIDNLKGKALEGIVGLKESEILRLQAPGSDIERFLTLKHLFGIRSVLEAYAGHRPTGADSDCAIVSVYYDEASTVIEAEIDISLLTERIKACTHCGIG